MRDADLKEAEKRHCEGCNCRGKEKNGNKGTNSEDKKE